jgi:hypothetical protein
MPKIVFHNEPSGREAYVLADGKTSVGRNRSNRLFIADDSVSRAHAEILTWGEEVIVRDLGSRNGTWVGGRKLSNAQYPVKVGEIIRLGSIQLRLDAARSELGDTTLDLALDGVTAFHHHARFLIRQRSGHGNAHRRPDLAEGGTPLGSEIDANPSEHTIRVVRGKETAPPTMPIQTPSNPGRRVVPVLLVFGICMVSFAALVRLISAAA